MLYRFLMFVIVGFGGYLIYRVSTNAWRKASVEDKLDEIELEKEIHDQIDNINEKETKTNKDDIDNFLKS